MKGNYLVVIQNKEFSVYPLDDRLVWEVGRLEPGTQPDICLSAACVSRRHGRFENMDGFWFYQDYNGKNGTVYNKKALSRKRKVLPVDLKDGDIFIFGSSGAEAIDERTAWAMYSVNPNVTRLQARVLLRDGCLAFSDGKEECKLLHPQKGTVVVIGEELAICMGDTVFLTEQMNLTQKNME